MPVDVDEKFASTLNLIKSSASSFRECPVLDG